MTSDRLTGPLGLFDLLDVNRVVARVQRTGNLNGFPFVLLCGSAVVKVIGSVRGRIFQRVLATALRDLPGKGLRLLGLGLALGGILLLLL